MDVSVIFVNYNTIDLLKNSIKSVIENTVGITYEMIVVDNNSDDDSETVLLKLFPEVVKYVKLPKNIGFGRANHEGIKKATGKFVFLLNPDTILLNNAVKLLLDFIVLDPKIGIVGGNLFDENRNPTYSYHRIIPSIWIEEANMLFLGLFRRFYRNMYFNYTLNPIEVGNVSGANMMFRREDYYEVGGFDPEFFMYSEETELTFRFKKKGFKVFNVPESKIIHLEGKSHRFKEKHEMLKFQGRSLYYRKSYGRVYELVADGLLFLGLIFRVFVSALILNKNQLVFSCLRIKMIVNYVVFKKRV